MHIYLYKLDGILSFQWVMKESFLDRYLKVVQKYQLSNLDVSKCGTLIAVLYGYEQKFY